MKSRIIISLLALAMHHECCATHICFVIHGTWAHTESWYQPGGDFFDELNKSESPHNIQLVPFSWSGKADYASRKQAGINLARLIRSYPADYTFTIVAHSHGCNVAIIASQELAQTKTAHRIAAVYALAPPVDRMTYMPNMDVIFYFFNLFSCNDFAQPFLGVFERTYPEHPRIANIRVLLNNKEPNHCQLHDPIIAQWLFSLPAQMPTKNGSYNLDCSTPALIHFFSNTGPQYAYDEKRTILLERDRWINSQLVGPFHRNVSRGKTK
jgi:hypothetical protein